MNSTAFKRIKFFNAILSSFTLSLVAVWLLAVSCNNEDEIPTQVVYGKPDSPMVFNLQVIDPVISSKNIEIRGFQSGNARLVANNSYVIYEPGAGFEYDEVEVVQNGNPIIRVIFFSADLNPDCNAFARSYKMDFRKNDPPASQTAYIDFCNRRAPSGRSISLTTLQPIDGFSVSGTSSIQLSFAPPPDFTGYGEFIYEVAAISSPLRGEIYEAEFLISGLVQITVTE